MACLVGATPMLRLASILLALFVLLPLRAEAARTMLILQALDGEYKLTFDDSKFSVDHMRSLARISPRMSPEFSLSSYLELCIEGDLRYRTCGTREIDAPNFYWNAEVNLKGGQEALDFLRALAYPKELEPVVKYLESEGSFYQCLGQTMLNFLKSWDSGVLRNSCGKIDPSTHCSHSLLEIEGSRSTKVKYDLLKYKWYNCMNSVFRNRIGNYPLQVWENFLRTYGITEELIE